MKRILIIDDDPDIHESLGSLLRSAGFEVHGSATVEKGIERIGEVRPDLIMLDIMFPEKRNHGFEAARRIKAEHPHLPVFVLSAVNRDFAFGFSKDDIEVEEFLDKPVRIERLLRLINSYI